eukprot:4807401-Amphidinium_carterae.1
MSLPVLDRFARCLISGVHKGKPLDNCSHCSIWRNGNQRIRQSHFKDFTMDVCQFPEEISNRWRHQQSSTTFHPSKL